MHETCMHTCTPSHAHVHSLILHAHIVKLMVVLMEEWLPWLQTS